MTIMKTNSYEKLSDRQKHALSLTRMSDCLAVVTTDEHGDVKDEDRQRAEEQQQPSSDELGIEVFR